MEAVWAVSTEARANPDERPGLAVIHDARRDGPRVVLPSLTTRGRRRIDPGTRPSRDGARTGHVQLGAMRSPRRSGGRPVTFTAAVLLGSATQLSVVVAFAGSEAGAYRGVPNGLGVLLSVVAGIVAGPLAGVVVALVGGVGYALFVSEDVFAGWVAVVIWIVAAAVAGAIADRYRETGRERDAAHLAERRARQAAESESVRLAQLQALTARLAGAATVREVCEVLVETVKDSFGAASAGVALLSMDGTELETVAARGYSDELRRRWSRFPSNTPVPATDAIAQRSVVTVETAEEASERYPLLGGDAPGHQLGAQAAAPLLAGDVVLGVLSATFRSERRFSHEDTSLLLALGRQCGQALERARLFEAERHGLQRAMELRELASALAAAASPAEVAEVAAARIASILGARAASIGALTVDGRAIEAVLTHGLTSEEARPFERIPIESETPPADAVRQKEPVLVGSPVELGERYPGLALAYQRAGDRAWACVPLMATDRPVGTLFVSYREAQAFDERQRAEIRSVADQFALALERSLLQRSREEAARLSGRVERVKAVSDAMSPGLGPQEVAGAILAETVEALGAVAGGVCVPTYDGTSLEVISRIGAPDDLADRLPVDSSGPLTDAYRSGVPVLVQRDDDRSGSSMDEDVLGRPAEAVIATPISAAGRPIGVIGLRFERTRAFSPDELRLVQTLAEETGEAFERARLFEAEQRALRRAARLQEVTARLARAVTTDDAARAILRGATGGVGAAAAAIALADDDGRSLRFVIGAMSRGTLTLRDPIVHSPDDRSALAHVYRTGREMWIPSHDLWRERFADGYATQRMLGRCLYAVPIVAKGQAIGSLAVYFEEERPEPTAEDVELIRSFAHQAGVALERARTYETEHEAAITLQRNLMPEGIAEGSGIEADGRYLPAIRGVHVGGDWYDIVDRPDGTVAFAVGDIAGHGLQAAAAMGQVRSAWRALALTVTQPSAILGSLDRFAAGVEGAFFSTVLTVLLDPSTGELRYASAGHPPALVIDTRGETRFLEGGRSVPLGLPFEQPRPQAVYRLQPGEVLVLYTDGLVERRGESLDEGFERLAAVARGVGGLPLSEISDALLELVAEDRHDDVALLVIGPTRQTRVFRRTFPADARQLAVMRAELRTWLERSSLSADAKDDIVLACTEAAANAIEHAYIGRRGQVHVRAESVGGWLEVTVSDEGRWRDPRPDDTRGRGLGLVRALLGDIDVERGEGGTTVRMRVGVP